MPRYFFHVTDHIVYRDQIGTIYPDIYAAQAAAIRASGERLQDLGSQFFDGTEWKMEVTDESGRNLFTLRFSVEEHGTTSE